MTLGLGWLSTQLDLELFEDKGQILLILACCRAPAWLSVLDKEGAQGAAVEHKMQGWKGIRLPPPSLAFPPTPQSLQLPWASVSLGSAPGICFTAPTALAPRPSAQLESSAALQPLGSVPSSSPRTGGGASDSEHPQLTWRALPTGT